MTFLKRQKGISTVELLITLFIAAAFLGVAYQLYIAVNRSINESRVQSEASNIAYEQLRLLENSVVNPCTPKDLAAKLPDNHTLGSKNGTPPTITARVTCPLSAVDLNSVSLLTVKLRYTINGQDEEVIHAIYVN